MCSYLDELLLFTKMKINMLDVDKSTKCLCFFLKDVFSLHVSPMRKKSLDFDITCCDELVNKDFFVDIDQSKFAIVVNNFISNAMRYTKPGGKVSIKLVSFYKPLSFSFESFFANCPAANKKVGIEAANFVRIEVTDTGVGLSPENMRKLFREGVQIDPNKNQGGGGSGFGLTLSKCLVEAHGGCVGIRSEGDGQGSTFFFELPLVPPTQTTQIVIDGSNGSIFENSVFIGNSPSSHDSGDAADMNVSLQPRALIVEDDKLCAKYTARSLKACGHQCIVVGDGIEATNIVRESIIENVGFAIITMDNRLPGLNGPEVIRKIREMKFTNPILGVTGDVDEETKLRFLDAGANKVFPKPLLQNAIRAYIASLSSRPQISALLVDDSELACKVLSRVLLNLNIKSHAVYDGIYAVEHVTECLSKGGPFPYDVIFMDNSMPIMNGPSAAKAIRELGVTVPIIALTGNVLEDDVRNFKFCGANAVLEKPLARGRLLSAFEDCGLEVL